MADDVLRPERRRPDRDVFGEEVAPTNDTPQSGNPWADIRESATGEDHGFHHPVDAQPAAPRPQGDGGMQVRNLPPQLAGLFQKTNDNGEVLTKQPHRQKQQSLAAGNDDLLTSLLKKLGDVTQHYEPVMLPSKGKFYDGTDGPADGVVYVRPMTGEEEQILATPRYVKRGKAIDMIFESCVRNPIQADKLLSMDRTYLLIYLRGISYTPQYEVEIKCPECGNHYQSTINLDELEVDECPDDFDADTLHGVLPVSKFRFNYRLARGSDEADINSYRERRAKQWGDNAVDDTLHYRTALLLEDIEGVTDKTQIQQLAKRLPIQDVAHIRNLVNQPPFGVDTDVDMLCPSCYGEFTVDLPLESNFFFPRRKKSNNRA